MQPFHRILFIVKAEKYFTAAGSYKTILPVNNLVIIPPPRQYYFNVSQSRTLEIYFSEAEFLSNYDTPLSVSSDVKFKLCGQTDLLSFPICLLDRTFGIKHCSSTDALIARGSSAFN